MRKYEHRAHSARLGRTVPSMESASARCLQRLQGSLYRTAVVAEYRKGLGTWISFMGPESNGSDLQPICSFMSRALSIGHQVSSIAHIRPLTVHDEMAEHHGRSAVR